MEADIRIGLPAFTIVGLADKAVREARERVRSAITNSGFEFPQKRITINLAPAYLRKIGPGFDLPLAMAILAASGQVAAEAVANCALAGELSLTGELRPMRGALAVAQGAAAHGIGRVMVPASRAREAALVEGLEVIGVTALHDAVDILAGRREVPPLAELEPEGDDAAAIDPPDLADVRGHDALLPAIVVAAAGGSPGASARPASTSTASCSDSMPSTATPGTSAASRARERGSSSRATPWRRVPSAIASAPRTARTSPVSDSSPTTAQSAIASSSTAPAATRIASASGRSNPGPILRR